MTRVRRRLALTWGLPLLIAVVTLALAAAFPASDVKGSVRTGPEGLGRLLKSTAGLPMSVQWGANHQSVILRTHPRRPCTVVLDSVSSTAPGRIEVDLDQPRVTGCTGPRHEQRFTLPLPIVEAPGQGVTVDLGGRVLHLERYRV